MCYADTVFNKDSEIRELERAQGFSFLYAQGIEPGDLTIGANNYLNVPEGSTIPPGYCSPDPGIQKTLMELTKQPPFRRKITKPKPGKNRSLRTNRPKAKNRQFRKPSKKSHSRPLTAPARIGRRIQTC